MGGGEVLFHALPKMSINEHKVNYVWIGYSVLCYESTSFFYFHTLPTLFVIVVLLNCIS